MMELERKDYWDEKKEKEIKIKVEKIKRLTKWDEERKEGEKFVILKLYDPELETEGLYLVKAPKTVTEKQLEKIIKAIVVLYNEADFEDWSYDDIMDTLEHLTVINSVDAERFYIQV